MEIRETIECGFCAILTEISMCNLMQWTDSKHLKLLMCKFEPTKIIKGRTKFLFGSCLVQFIRAIFLSREDPQTSQNSFLRVLLE